VLACCRTRELLLTGLVMGNALVLSGMANFRVVGNPDTIRKRGRGRQKVTFWPNRRTAQALHIITLEPSRVTFQSENVGSCVV
jgi:hypothetical protein